MREKQTSHDKETKILGDLITANANLEGLLSRLREAELLKTRAKNCERKRPWLHYALVRQEHKSAVKKAKILQNKLNQIYQERICPLEIKLQEVKKSLSTARSLSNHSETLAQNSIENAKLMIQDLLKLQVFIGHKRSKIHSTRSSLDKWKKDLENAKDDLQKAQEQFDFLLKSLGNNFDISKLTTRMEELNRDLLRPIMHSIAKCKAEQANIRLTNESSQIIICEAQQRLALLLSNQNASSLNTVQSNQLRKEQGLSRFFGDSLHARRLIETSKKGFVRPVIGPLCLEIDVVSSDLIFKNLKATTGIFHDIIRHSLQIL